MPGYAVALPFGGKNGFTELGKKMPSGTRKNFERFLWGVGGNFFAQPGTYQTHYETVISNMIPWAENGVLDILAPNFKVKLFAVENGRLFPEVLQGFMPFDFLPTRNDWSLINVGVESRSAALMAPAFKDPTPEISAVAQSEIYNAQWYDLYTQNWRAKLTPNNLLVDTRHHDKLMSSVSKAATLKKILELGEDELVSTH